jgi:hypothetical protein
MSCFGGGAYESVLQWEQRIGHSFRFCMASSVGDEESLGHELLGHSHLPPMGWQAAIMLPYLTAMPHAPTAPCEEPLT